MTQFVLAGLAAVVLISAGTIYVVRRNATSEAIRNAREVAGIDGHAIAEPVLSDGVLTGDPGRWPASTPSSTSASSATASCG